MALEMSAAQSNTLVHIGDWRTFARTKFFSLLNTYNCFLMDKTHLQLNFYEGAIQKSLDAVGVCPSTQFYGHVPKEKLNSKAEVTLEGFLVVSWGIKRPIRLKIQDEKHSDSSKSPGLSPGPVSPLGNKRGMTRWGEFDNLHHIEELEEIIQDGAETLDTCATDYSEFDSRTLRAPRPKAIIEESSSLFRTRSDASLVKKRVKNKEEERNRDKQHRFSINGHFYNYKTSIFTPTYGATTNVRISSRMKTHEVISQLLHKFKIENEPSDFALYCIHQSGERRKLSSSDLPLWERFLQGPSENIMRIFLMDTDEEEVSMEVAQYVNLELPILQGVLLKLQEEENQEIQNAISKYRQQHVLLSHCLTSKLTSKTETTV